MKQGGTFDSNTITGLIFESKADLLSLFAATPNYNVQPLSSGQGADIFYDSKLVARCFKKHEFYKYLTAKGIVWKEVLSKKLLPDNTVLVISKDTLYIIEIKYQQVEGSVDEKLQTCDFKRKQYMKLVAPLNLTVEYVYVLSDWFKQTKYQDTLDYIKSVGCHYWFGEIPLSWLGLPTPEFT